MGSHKDHLIEQDEEAAFDAVSNELGGNPDLLREAGMQVRPDRMNDGTLHGYWIDFDDEGHPEAQKMRRKHGTSIQLPPSFFDRHDNDSES